MSRILYVIAIRRDDVQTEFYLTAELCGWWQYVSVFLTDR
jgi:hypothetical protein